MGWWVWAKRSRGAAGRSSARASGCCCGRRSRSASATLVLVPILRAAHGAAPGWDALTTSMSLGAQLLLNLKRLETWYVWIAVDVIYVPLYFSRDLNLTALVYVVFLGLCVRGGGSGVPSRSSPREVPAAARRAPRARRRARWRGARGSRCWCSVRRPSRSRCLCGATGCASGTLAPAWSPGWDEMPVDFDDPLVHDAHIEVMERLLNGRPDVVFTGEDYGDLLASRWGIEHVRLQRPGTISGTQVRADPAAFWDRAHPGRARVVCAGGW